MFTYGFTGTAQGMTPDQITIFRQLMRDQQHGYVVFRHGGCVGADQDAHQIVVVRPEFDVIVHPGVTHDGHQYKRGEFQGAVNVHEPKYFLQRNRDIVNLCDLLIACPKGFEEERRSGTWATIRYAMSINKDVLVIWPDGHPTKLSHHTKVD